MDSSYQTPDLASVLATLAAYGPPQSTAPQPTIPSAPPVPEVEEEEYDPADFQFIDTHSSVASQSTPVSSITTPKSIQFVPQPPPPSSVSSVSQIVTWAPALRYVMNNVFRKPEAMHSIQHMIKTQQQHERQWWEGRKALLQKQASRDDARKKLDDVL